MKINSDLLNYKTEYIDSNENAYTCSYVNSLAPVYINSRTVTPEFDCYAEVFLSYSGWTYDGTSKTISIGTSGSPTVIAATTVTMAGHNTILDAGFLTGVYKLNKNTKYTFTISGMNGGGGVNSGYIKLIPIKE